MRLDTFLEAKGLVASPVERFDGFVIDVGASAGWQEFESAVGLHVWVCRSEPRVGAFTANAVLTLHRVDAVLDHSEAFTMLVEQQLAMIPNCRERQRQLMAATEGAGSLGRLMLVIDHESGLIESESRSRLLSTDRDTYIAQLTVTALQHSPMDRSSVWMTVKEGARR